MKRKLSFILALLITLLIATNISLFQLNKQGKSITITRAIDGDTFKSGVETYRLININAPEKGEKGYEEAKQFLSEFEGLSVTIEELSTDRYDRVLVRVYTPEYINLELVKKGLAKKFLVQDSELRKFNQAELSAVQKGDGIWQKSDYFGCFETEIKEVKETIKIENFCNINMEDFTVADESRKRYKFPEITFSEINLNSNEGVNNETDLFWNSKQNIWNNDRDTLYIYDSQNLLAHHDSYSY